MACRLFGANHYLNQHWLVVNWNNRNNFQWNSIEIRTFSFKKIQLKTSSAKFWLFCLNDNYMLTDGHIDDCLLEVPVSYRQVQTVYISLYSDARYYTPYSWWRHQIETFSALLAICAGNSPVTGEFPTQRPVTRSFDVFFDLRLNKRLSKQSWGWWFWDAIAPIMTSPQCLPPNLQWAMGSSL